MPKLKIATFNVENLFERAKLMNFKSLDTGAGRLGAFQDLVLELKRKTYRQDAITRLMKELKGFVKIEATRGKLFKGNRGTTLAAKGVDDWDGHLALTRAKLSDKARANTAEVLETVNADIVCLIEVENRITLKSFMTDCMGAKKKYPHVMCVDGNDQRGIDVAIASRHPIGWMRSHVDDRVPGGTGPVFSRDCLEVRVDVGGRTVHLLLNHLKSQGYGEKAANDARRRQQAKRVAEILGDYSLTKDLVVVCGDLNDAPDSAPLAPLMSVPHLTDALEAKNVPAADRWTYHYKKNQQLDYLLLSDALRGKLDEVGVYRRGIWEIEKFTVKREEPLPGMEHWTDAASDHGALWATFEL